MSTIIRVFLASPSGLDDERDAARSAAGRINSTLGIKFDTQLIILGYENAAHPGKGADAQDVVNHQIKDNYDVFVGILWDRVGTETNRAPSGTIEEYDRALKKQAINGNVDLMVYFKSDSVSPDKIDPDQLKLLQEFKNRVSKDGNFYSSFKTPDDFAALIRDHLESIVLERLIPTPQTSFFKDYAIQESGKANCAGEMQNASLAIVVNGHVLVACRSEEQKVGPGLWQLPGGKVENEESPLDAMLREMQEELGLELDAKQIESIGTVNSNALGTKKKSLIKMSLYYCEMSERPELRLESSISSVSWLSLSTISSCNLDFLGDNLTMLRLVRRYHFAYRPLLSLDNFLSTTTVPRLPHSLPNLNENLPNFTEEQTQTLFSILDVLGFISQDDLGLSRRPESIALMNILLEWCRTTRSVFEAKGSSDWQTNMLLLNSGDSIRRYQQTLFERHASLSALMSYKLSKVLSQREVCDILLFAKIRGETHLLLRWDIQDKREQKYQILSKGLEELGQSCDPKDCARARYVVEKRLSKGLAKTLVFEWLDSFQTFHVSAGSIENVKLTRQYDVSVFLAKVPNECVKGLLEIISTRNRQARIVMERDDVSRETRRDTVSLKWARLDALLTNGLEYEGNRVRGFAEILDRLGEEKLREIAEKNAVDLTEYEDRV